MERFYNAMNRFDAYLLLHRLQQAGIAAHVFKRAHAEHRRDVAADFANLRYGSSAHRGSIPRRNGARRSARGAKLKRARVRCTNCGEDNPANFRALLALRAESG